MTSSSSSSLSSSHLGTTPAGIHRRRPGRCAGEATNQPAGGGGASPWHGGARLPVWPMTPRVIHGPAPGHRWAGQAARATASRQRHVPRLRQAPPGRLTHRAPPSLSIPARSLAACWRPGRTAGVTPSPPLSLARLPPDAGGGGQPAYVVGSTYVIPGTSPAACPTAAGLASVRSVVRSLPCIRHATKRIGRTG